MPETNYKKMADSIEDSLDFAGMQHNFNKENWIKMMKEKEERAIRRTMRRIKTERLFRRILSSMTYILGTIIFIASVIPIAPPDAVVIMGSPVNNLDGIFHLVIYAIFGAVGAFQRRWWFCAVVAIGTELIQVYLPWRDYSFLDAMANLVGILIFK